MGVKGVIDAVLEDKSFSCERSMVVANCDGKHNRRLGRFRVRKGASRLSRLGVPRSLRFAQYNTDAIRTKYREIPAVEELNRASHPSFGGLDFFIFFELNGLHGRIGHVI
jgi:hypothetical protein